jgi:hypothetical protein
MQPNSLAAYLPLLRELVGMAEDIVVTLRHRRPDGVPARLILAFVTKAAQTGRGIVVLYERGLHHEAQSLIRIIFEINISFDHFFRMLKQDPQSACRRVVDSMMLEKVKQQRASGFKGLDLLPDGPSQNDFETEEATIAQQYTTAELRAMRKYGFTGLSVEERAKEVGRGDLYQLVYRNFSRNIHGLDFMELLLADEPSLIGDDRYSAYLESRDATAVDVAIGCLGCVVEAVNTGFGLGLDARLMLFAKEWQRVRDTE